MFSSAFSIQKIMSSLAILYNWVCIYKILIYPPILFQWNYDWYKIKASMPNTYSEPEIFN